MHSDLRGRARLSLRDRDRKCDLSNVNTSKEEEH